MDDLTMEVVRDALESVLRDCKSYDPKTGLNVLSVETVSKVQQAMKLLEEK